MEFKGTPAPWFWEGSVLCNKDFIVGGYGYNFNNQANKNLIAAAPELLEALIECRKWVLCKELQDKADLIIAKALGEKK